MSTRSDIILNRICQTAAEQKATDLYLFPVQTPFLRVDSQIISLPSEEILNVSLLEEMVDSLLTQEEKEKFEKEKQLIVVKKIGKVGNAQISFVCQKSQISICLKLFTQEIENLDGIGLPPVVKNFTQLFQGIVFVTGTRDSGRSSLVISLLDFINKNQAKFISTLEQPIKYRLEGAKSIVEQREVGKDVFSPKDGLSYIKKRNIDVAMVSYCDSPEILEELLKLAESGILVFTIIDAPSSLSAINRIVNFFPPERKESICSLLADSLGGVISMRLVPKLVGGRVRALEILPGSRVVKNLIREDKIKQLENILELGTDNAISLDRYLADLVSAGEITAENGIKYCLNERRFEALLRR